MAEPTVQRRLAAILAADVAGYTSLMEKDEAGTVAAWKAARTQIIDPRIGEFGGRIVKHTGDGFLAEFRAITNAVDCAVAMQKDLAENPLEFRMGVNLGDVIEELGDIHGEGVNVAARLEGLAEPGGICISGEAHALVRNRVNYPFTDLGEHEVKHVTQPVHVFAIGLETAHAHEPDPVAPHKPSIAVLPFDNLSGDPDQEYFSDGISEDIITALSRIRSFFVIARNTTFTFKGRAVDVTAIAKELRVRYVLEGSVRKAGNRVRISAQLIDAATGNHIWAEHYDRDLDDVFAVQDEITQTVVGAVEPELSRAEQERARLKPPESLDAWDCYQRGLWHLWHFKDEENAKAHDLLERAVEIDPNFSAAFAALSFANSQPILLGVAESPERSFALALEFAEKALALDDREPFAYWSRGLFFHLKREPASACAEFGKAIEINPSFAMAHTLMGIVRNLNYSPEEALPYLEAAERLSPKDPTLWANYSGRGLAYLFMGDLDTAEEWGRKAIRIPNAPAVAYANYLAILGHRGDRAQAREIIDRIEEINPKFSVKSVAEILPTTRDDIRDTVLDGLRKAGLREE